MKEMFKRLRTFLNERGVAPGSLGVLLGIMALLLVVCLFVGGSFAREQVFPVYISEVVASNTGYPNAQGRCSDFIEICNSADYPVDLSGFQLGDIEGKTRYGFASGTVIGPGRNFVNPAGHADVAVPETHFQLFADLNRELLRQIHHSQQS